MAQPPVADRAPSRWRQPTDVLHDPRLSRREKVRVLEEWAQDARLRATAEEENMTGGPRGPDLHDVLEALRQLREGHIGPPSRPSLPRP